MSTTLWQKGNVSVTQTEWSKFGGGTVFHRYLYVGKKIVAYCSTEKVWETQFKSSPEIFAQKKMEKRRKVIAKEIKRYEGLIAELKLEDAAMVVAQKLP